MRVAGVPPDTGSSICLYAYRYSPFICNILPAGKCRREFAGVGMLRASMPEVDSAWPPRPRSGSTPFLSHSFDVGASSGALRALSAQPGEQVGAMLSCVCVCVTVCVTVCVCVCGWGDVPSPSHSSWGASRGSSAARTVG